MRVRKRVRALISLGTMSLLSTTLPVLSQTSKECDAAVEATAGFVEDDADFFEKVLTDCQVGGLCECSLIAKIKKDVEEFAPFYLAAIRRSCGANLPPKFEEWERRFKGLAAIAQEAAKRKCL